MYARRRERIDPPRYLVSPPLVATDDLSDGLVLIDRESVIRRRLDRTLTSRLILREMDAWPEGESARFGWLAPRSPSW